MHARLPQTERGFQSNGHRGAMVLLAAAEFDARHKWCVEKLPIVNEDLRASVTKEGESKLDAWSGRTWVKVTRVAVGGADPTHTVRMDCTVCGTQGQSRGPLPMLRSPCRALALAGDTGTTTSLSQDSLAEPVSGAIKGAAPRRWAPPGCILSVHIQR